jgi:glycosyltransferase involved in cell wall biosynthesis
MSDTRLPITLVVITHNEEQNISRCLQAADFCAEQLVIDSGSTDRTIELASSLGARVLPRVWTGYRDQKNYGSEQAAQDWVLCIDADEVISRELAANIRAEFARGPDCDAYELNRHSYYAGQLINHSGWYPQWRLFLYRKGAASWGGIEPHTTVVHTGQRRGRLQGDLFHYTYRDISHHMTKLVAQARDSARAMHSAGRSATVADLVLRGPWAFGRAYVFERGILDGFYGLVISASAGYYTFLKYAMLRELQRQQRRMP